MKNEELQEAVAILEEIAKKIALISYLEYAGFCLKLWNGILDPNDPTPTVHLSEFGYKGDSCSRGSKANSIRSGLLEIIKNQYPPVVMEFNEKTLERVLKMCSSFEELMKEIVQIIVKDASSVVGRYFAPMVRLEVKAADQTIQVEIYVSGSIFPSKKSEFFLAKNESVAGAIGVVIEQLKAYTSTKT